MEETIGKAGLRDAAIGTGIAVDKMLALTGQMPSINIANIPMPSAEEIAERKATHAKLDAIFRRTLPQLPEDDAYRAFKLAPQVKQTGNANRIPAYTRRQF